MCRYTRHAHMLRQAEPAQPSRSVQRRQLQEAGSLCSARHVAPSAHEQGVECLAQAAVAKLQLWDSAAGRTMHTTASTEQPVQTYVYAVQAHTLSNKVSEPVEKAAARRNWLDSNAEVRMPAARRIPRCNMANDNEYTTKLL